MPITRMFRSFTLSRRPPHLLALSTWRKLTDTVAPINHRLTEGEQNGQPAGDNPQEAVAATGQPRLRVFIVAGEASGDELGGALMRSLGKLSPVPIYFSGIGGAHMTSAGLQSLLPMTSLSVMGFVELLPHFWRLQRAFSTAVSAATTPPLPDAVVTIDYKGFNFRLLRQIHEHRERSGARRPALIHYVAPSVWALRGGASPPRMQKLQGLLDALLCVLPFEPAIWSGAGVDIAHYVGHPVLEPRPAVAELVSTRGVGMPPPEPSLREGQDSGQSAAGPVVCLLPGSRRQEVDRHLPLFRKTVTLLAPRHPGLSCVLPVLPSERAAVDATVDRWPVSVRVVDASELQPALRMCDAALACSGSVTAQLAAAGLPTVVTYRAHPITEAIARWIVATPFVSLPNIVTGREVMTEALLGDATPDRLASLVSELLTDAEVRQRQVDGGREFMSALRSPAPDTPPSMRAAQIVLSCIAHRPQHQPKG